MDLQIFEIKLEEKYSQIYSSLLFQCRCIFFFFDITNPNSFKKLKECIKKFEKKDKNNKIKKYLIANKCDEEANRQVSGFEIKEYLDNNSPTLELIEISVKTKENLSEVMNAIHNAYLVNDKSLISNTVHEYENNDRNYSIYAKTIYKLILLGDGTVGKTSFFKRYFNNDFNDNYMMTIGVNDSFKFIQIQKNVIKIKIWDTAGQERFRSLPRKYYQHVDGIILLYDVTSRESFNNISKWIKDIADNSGNKVIIYLVGNKIDLIDERKVEFSEAMETATKNGMRSMEISCKLDINVKEVITNIASEIYEVNTEKRKRDMDSFNLTVERENKDMSCCSSSSKKNKNNKESYK
jgi:small GTP-binding protein